MRRGWDSEGLRWLEWLWEWLKQIFVELKAIETGELAHFIFCSDWMIGLGPDDVKDREIA